MGPDHARGDIASFPLLWAWLQELQPDGSTEDAQKRLEDKLNAILANQLRRSGFFDKDDVIDCRHDVYMLLERKLREPLEFSVDSVRCDPAHRVQLDAIEAEVMHLLRAEPFAIIVCHADFEASSTFCASLHDIEDGGEIVTCSSLPCMQERLVAIRLAYGALRHEEEAFLELSPAGHITWLYYARVKAICHESFAIRMGFLTSAARKIVLKHSFKERKERDLTRLADLPPWREPGRRDSGQDVALLAAKRAIKRLPKDLLAQLRQRYMALRRNSTVYPKGQLLRVAAFG